MTYQIIPNTTPCYVIERETFTDDNQTTHDPFPVIAWEPTGDPSHPLRPIYVRRGGWTETLQRDRCYTIDCHDDVWWVCTRTFVVGELDWTRFTEPAISDDLEAIDRERARRAEHDAKA